MNWTKNPNLKKKKTFFFLFWGVGVGGVGGGGGGERERGGEEGDSNRKKENTKNNRYSLIFCAHALYKISSSWLKWFSSFNTNKRSNCYTQSRAPCAQVHDLMCRQWWRRVTSGYWHHCTTIYNKSSNNVRIWIQCIYIQNWFTNNTFYIIHIHYNIHELISSFRWPEHEVDTKSALDLHRSHTSTADSH